MWFKGTGHEKNVASTAACTLFDVTTNQWRSDISAWAWVGDMLQSVCSVIEQLASAMKRLLKI